MDSFEINKIVGALLGTVLFLMLLGLATNSIYSPHQPEKMGWDIEVAEVEENTDRHEEVVQVEPLSVRLAAADADKGKKVARKCLSCHTFDEGGKNGVGPNLWDIVLRPVASVGGFGYSSALSDYAQTHPEWTYEALEAFIANPKAEVSGTAMSFAGIKNEKDLLNLIAYMRNLSDAPKPLE